MPRTEAANQRLRDEQRTRILEAARTVFARRGLAGTMAEVAGAAGVSQGLAYRYFASKDELFRALVAEALRSDETAVQPPGSPGELLERLISRLLEARHQNPALLQLMYHVLSDPDTPRDLLEMGAKRRESLARGLRRLIVEGQATGEVAKDDPDQLVAAILALLDGLTRLVIASSGTEPAIPNAQIVMRMLRP